MKKLQNLQSFGGGAGKKKKNKKIEKSWGGGQS